MRAVVSLSFVFVCALLPRGASAVLQPTPGGIVIPRLDTGVTTCSDKNVQPCLDVGEHAAGLIDAQKDALVAPETFDPTCALTFTAINKGGTNSVAFGWYNVQSDPSDAGTTRKPARSELYAMMVMPTGYQNNAQLATVAPKALDLAAEKAAGHYQGGPIAFWLASDNSGGLGIDANGVLTGNPNAGIFYTEHAFNPGSGATQTYYQVLTWQSVATKNAFYFGWEDLPANSGSDNDFDDLIFFVTGIQCTGGGAACQTGQKGVCADGTMQCQKGVLTCIPNQKATAETCNALDDNCDGQVDEGDLCPTGEVCDRGRCVPSCSNGEFKCQIDEVCTNRGLCVEAACADKQCPAGQVCSGGVCSDACTDVVCPYGRVCRGGVCVDPCAGIQCDEGYSCVLGVCQSCQCTACASDRICTGNMCIERACSTVTCGAGTHCLAGSCADNCQGVNCPKGMVCEAGECRLGEGGIAVGEEPEGGPVVILGVGGFGGQVVQAGGAAGADGAALGSAADDGSSAGRGEAASGCGCRAVGGPMSTAWGALLALAGAALRRRRAAR